MGKVDGVIHGIGNFSKACISKGSNADEKPGRLSCIKALSFSNVRRNGTLDVFCMVRCVNKRDQANKGN